MYFNSTHKVLMAVGRTLEVIPVSYVKSWRLPSSDPETARTESVTLAH
jgi:hypothetical protein